MSASDTTLLMAAARVLNAAAPDDKIAAARYANVLRKAGAPLGEIGQFKPPDRPARPERPLLVPPTRTLRRGLGSPEGRAALLHAIGHIEFNAIDLAFDMAVRFAGAVDALGLDTSRFVADWVTVGADEARHFGLITDRLKAFGAGYGDFPAHDGLWEAAAKTHHDLTSRLVVAPLILEARGLDVTPGMIKKLAAVGDQESADALQIIYDDEIGHVACGRRWFHNVCIEQDADPATTFQRLKQKYVPGVLKPPFNHAARDKAGLPRLFYEPN